MKDSKKKRSKEVVDSGTEFSTRFNAFLDAAGYPDINQGRLTAFADDMEISVSGARKWIVEDTPPRGKKLIDVCIKIISLKLPSKYNPRKMACWLEYGDEVVPNPFSSGVSVANDHRIMGSLYVLVHKLAAKLKIDIYAISPKIMDDLYKELMDEVVSNKLSMPDERFVNSLLVLAEKKSQKK